MDRPYRSNAYASTSTTSHLRRTSSSTRSNLSQINKSIQNGTMNISTPSRTTTYRSDYPSPSRAAVPRAYPITIRRANVPSQDLQNDQKPTFYSITTISKPDERRDESQLKKGGSTGLQNLGNTVNPLDFSPLELEEKKRFVSVFYELRSPMFIEHETAVAIRSPESFGRRTERVEHQRDERRSDER